MSRNLSKEMTWRKENYIRFEVQLNKEQANIFKKYLKNKNLSFSEWCKNKINEELLKEGINV